MMKLRLAHARRTWSTSTTSPSSRTSARRATRSPSARSPGTLDLLKSELLWQHFPVFRDAEQVIADPVVRNRGTIGGSLCQADAAEDLSAVCAALKAERRHPRRAGRAHRRDERVPRRPVDDRGPGRRDPHRGAPAGPGRVRAARTRRSSAGRGTGRSPRPRPRCGSTATRSPTPGIALSAVGLTTIDLTRAEELLRGQTPVATTCSRRPARSPPRTARRWPTGAGPSTTSATSLACSPNAHCAARAPAALGRRP